MEANLIYLLINTFKNLIYVFLKLRSLDKWCHEIKKTDKSLFDKTVIEKSLEIFSKSSIGGEEYYYIANDLKLLLE